MNYFLNLLLVFLTAFPTQYASAATAVISADFLTNGAAAQRNYIRNGEFEKNVAGVSAYKDAAGVRPVDATAGTPTHITCARTTSTPLAGDGSLLISNSGSTSAQGEGCSIPFTIDAGDDSATQTISFKYATASGTYVSGDLIADIYDDTTSSLISLTLQPSNSVLSLNAPFVWTGQFKPAASSRSFRLAFHVASTNSVAWAVKVDTVIVGPGPAFASGASVPPTQSVVSTTQHTGGFSANSSGTYTTPANAAWLEIEMVGGGGGSSGSGTSSTGGVGGDGASSTFGTSLLIAPGGGGGQTSGGGGAAGSSPTINSPAFGAGFRGGFGGYASYTASTATYLLGGTGGSTIFGAGGGAGNQTTSTAGAAETGAGASGAGTNAVNSIWGGGGGAGGSGIKAIIINPAASYAFVSGAGGTAGGAGTNGAVGFVGGSGFIKVTEHYLNAALGNGGAVTPTISKATATGSAAGTGGFSGGTNYITPANVAFIKVRMAGGGGGGSGGGTASWGAGGAGGNTTFGTSLLTANGGAGAPAPGSGQATGGSATIASPAIGTPQYGGGGGATMFSPDGYAAGGSGGANPFGGEGRGGASIASGNAALANTGGGGAGGGSGSTGNGYGGMGGGAGGYIEAIIVPTPGQSFPYSVGTAGTFGAAGSGSSAQDGGPGGTGYIEVTEYYLNGAIGTATNITGTNDVSHGGTGLTSITANRIPYASATDTYSTSSNLTFNGTTLSANTANFAANLRVNTAANESVERMTIKFAGNTEYGIYMVDTAGTTGAYMQFYNSSGGQAGAILHNGSTGTLYNTTSDYRLKENVIPINDALGRLMKLRPSHYDFISDKMEMDGFLAHELQEIVPYAVSGKKDEVDANGKPKYQSVDYSKLTPLITAALQEEVKKREALEQSVGELKKACGF